MTLSDLLNRIVNRLLRGDHPVEGILRFVIFLILPLSILFTNIIISLVYGYSFLIGQILLLYFLGLISAFTAAISYIKDIYVEETDDTPFRYFVACFFGLFPPQVVIANGEKKSPWLETVEKIGGPALLKIQPGYAVLTESLTAPANIFGQGHHFMTRFERIYEIIDLHEQEGSTDLKATTKDGIEVIVGKIKFNYRLWDSRWDTLYRDPAVARNPFPYSRQAIFNYAYNRNVRSIPNHPGETMLTPWLDAVRGQIESIVKEYINKHQLDDVIAPREHNKKDPREEIRQNAYQPEFKNRLRSIGTNLRWWDPGEYRSEKKDVEDQYLANWSVDLIGNVKLNRAYGEAQKLAYEELGRAEAEAELLMSIIHALDGIKLNADKTRTLQNLILMRTAQVIKALNTPGPNALLSKSTGEEAPNKDLQSK